MFSRSSLAFSLQATFFACFLLTQFSAYAQTSNVEGATTDTKITHTSSTQTDIIPAPTDARGNTYNDYRIFTNPDGHTINFHNVDARTIINEVVEPNPSYLGGIINILGPRANFILVNPFGMTVNGGRFINTAHLILATAGKKDPYNSGLEPDALLPNAPDPDIPATLLYTSQGTLSIGEEGLIGEFFGLELIAKNIVQNGKITNTNSNSNSTTGIVAGETITAISPDLATTQADRKNILHIGGPKSSPEEILVDISPLASITDANIQIVVNDAGAGVHVRGNLEATEGNIDIISAGDAKFSEAILAAQKGISVLAMRDAAFDKSIVLNGEANSGMSIKGAISVTFADNDLVSAGSANISSIGPIISERSSFYFGNRSKIESEKSDILFRSSTFTAFENLDLQAPSGDIVNFIGRTVVPNRDIVESYSRKERRMFFFSEKTSGMRVNYGEELEPGRIADINALGDISLSAKNIINIGGNISSLGSLTISAANLLYNSPLVVGNAWFEMTCGFFCSRNGFSNVRHLGGSIESLQPLNINATTVHNQGGSISSIADLNINADTVIAEAREQFVFRSPFLGMRGNYGFMSRFDQGGVFQSHSGRLAINTLSPVVIRGGELISANAYEIPNGVFVERERVDQSDRYSVNLGALWNIF